MSGAHDGDHPRPGRRPDRGRPGRHRAGRSPAPGVALDAVDARARGARRRRPRPRLRHLPLVLQAGPRRPALPRQGPGRRRPRERRRARHPDGGHRAPPRPRAAHGDAADSAVTRLQAGVTRGGLLAGDLLRRGARTRPETLPRPRRLSATETLPLAPALRPAGLRGGLLSWDGQLEDDARLVTTVARTAASYGAHVRTHVRVLSATGTEVELRDELTGETSTVRTRASSTPPASGPATSSTR